MFRRIPSHNWLILIALVSSNLWASSTFTLPTGEVLQDPTKPQLWNAPAQVVSQDREASFKLSYIVSSGKEKRAMINNRKVTVGDVISGATVESINSDSVYLLYKGKQKELRMNKVKGITRN